MSDSNNIFSTLWMFIVPMVSILVPVWLGLYYARHRIKSTSEAGENSIGSAVGATLGLLAFMLGIIFQVVGDRFEKRQELVISEISELRTVYMYAGLVPEPIRSATRNSIVNYTDASMAYRKNRISLQQMLSTSDAVLDSLWTYSESLAAQDRSSEAYSLYMSAVASLKNVYKERLMVIFQTRLPLAIYCILGFVGFTSMLILGFQFGVSGGTGFRLTLLLSISFAAVMWLIFALDRPETGFVKVNQQPFYSFYDELHKRSP